MSVMRKYFGWELVGWGGGSGRSEVVGFDVNGWRGLMSMVLGSTSSKFVTRGLRVMIAAGSWRRESAVSWRVSEVVWGVDGGGCSGGSVVVWVCGKVEVKRPISSS